MKYASNSIESTAALAVEILQYLKDNNIKYIILSGELGAGKTMLVKSIASAAGSSSIVTSPTFSIHNSYAIKDGYILHSDLYRIESELELEQTGFFELIEEATLAFIEWGDKFGLKDMLERYAKIDIIKTGENSREISVTIVAPTD